MIKKLKKIVAGVLSAAMIFTCAGCTVGKGTAYALTVDGYQIRAGVFIYYSYTALLEAENEAAGLDENLDTTDEEALKKTKIDGKDFVEYVQDKATEDCVEHVAILRHFDELGLELSEEQKAEIKDSVDSVWESNGDMFSANGISRESINEIMTSSYKGEEIFNAYYGEGGSENVTDNQLREYYSENNARVKYVDMDLHDADGNDLDEEGLEEIRSMAEDFLARAKSAEDTEEMLSRFDEFQEEYDQYVSDQAASAVEDDESEETTEAETTEATEAETTEATEVETTEAIDTDESQEAADTEETTADTEDATEESAATTTVAETDSEEEETTTTTTDPYANETIVSVVTTEEGDTEEDVSYSPSKECYDWIFNEATEGVPDIVENEDTIYVIVRLDIEERMTEDDLWSETNVENVRYIMFTDALQDKISEVSKAYKIERNDRAYKKYDPFDIMKES